MDLLRASGIAAASDEPIRAWLSLLRTWNARIDLTAARDERELHDLMLADAVILARTIAEGARVVDVGTGAGAPGLALALVRPDLRVTLVEPLAKRAAFLRTVLGTLGRTDVKLHAARGEDVAAKEGSAWDVAVSRATLAPAAWVPLGLALAPEAFVLLAKDDAPDVPGAAHDEPLAYTWPLTEAARRLVRYRRAP